MLGDDYFCFFSTCKPLSTILSQIMTFVRTSNLGTQLLAHSLFKWLFLLFLFNRRQSTHSRFTTHILLCERLLFAFIPFFLVHHTSRPLFTPTSSQSLTLPRLNRFIHHFSRKPTFFVSLLPVLLSPVRNLHYFPTLTRIKWSRPTASFCFFLPVHSCP